MSRPAAVPYASAVPARELVYRWEWSLEASPEALWPLVSDTNRFNAETGVPAIEPLGVEPGGRRRLRLRAAGRRIDYVEEPFEWVRPKRFAVLRRYGSGPLAELRARLELEPRAGGGSRLVYEARAVPRGLFGPLVVRVAIGRIARARMDEAFRRYDRIALGTATPPRARARLASGGPERLERRKAELGRVVPGRLAVRLASAIEEGDGIELSRMRPYELADEWGEGRRDVLELCLHATRAGMLESRWELVCPSCRGAVQTAPSLAGIEQTVHCESCQIDASATLDRSVELTFRPSPAIREVEQRTFCVGGPGVTPHVVAQQVLSPGEERTLELALDPGGYRLRALGVPGARPFVVAPGEETSAVPFVNADDEERVVVAERTAWSDLAATAADVTALQAFRDLFATEVLLPGEEMSVGTLAVAFTDLRESTRLYREIGDALAFGSVVSHFDVLREAIAREGGALVKTIGDAVMAVSRRPVVSLEAILYAQARLAQPPDASRPLLLKAGIHAGPCIAVTLNERLDYFGSTVNAAARIVGLSTGRDVVISGAVRADPEVEAFLAHGGFRVDPVEAALKGFDGDRFELWRVARVD
jgi:class 3 adenylate cyclase